VHGAGKSGDATTWRRDDRGAAGPKEMHVAVCAECGGEARVPFKPRGDRPVYCSSCFSIRK